VLASSGVDREPVGSNQRIYNLCLLLLTKHAQSGVTAKTGSLEIRIMCLSGAMCICPLTVVSVS